MAKPTPQWHSPTRQTPIRFQFSAPSVSSRRSSNSPRSSGSSIRGSPCSGGDHLSSPSSPASNNSSSSPNHDRRLSIYSTTSTTTSATSAPTSSLSSAARQQQQLFTHIRHKFQQGLHTLEDLQTFLEVTIKTAATATATDQDPLNSSSSSDSANSNETAAASNKKQAHRTATAKALKPHQPSVRNLLSNMIIMAKWLVDYLHTVEREEGGCFFSSSSISDSNHNRDELPQPQENPRKDSYPVRSTSLASPTSSPPVSPYRLKSARAGGRCADAPAAGEHGGAAAARAARAQHAAVVQELRGELHSYSWRVMRITTILKEWL